MARVHHIVLLRFHPQRSPADIDKVFQQVAELQKLIPGIDHFSGGPYSSSEGLNQGLTHGFLIAFSSVESRDAYLTHPEHERVKNAILPCIEQVIAFDYELP